jgi:hypothetical protein
VSGGALAAGLRREFEYRITRQTGSHLRLTTQVGGEHHVTVPNHDALRVGTLAAVRDDVAAHAGLTRDEVLGRLFD